MDRMLRTRWAAIGAALAVALGAGGLGVIHATSPSDAAAYVPLVPCRLADTRSDSNVGPRATPLGADEAVVYDGWGDVPGDCNLPAGTRGLQLNVTAVGASAALRFSASARAAPASLTAMAPLQAGVLRRERPGSPKTRRAIPGKSTRSWYVSGWLVPPKPVRRSLT